MTMEISVLYTNDGYSDKSHPVLPNSPTTDDGALGDTLRIRFRSYDIGVDLVFNKDVLAKFLGPMSKTDYNGMRYNVQTEVWKKDPTDEDLKDKDGDQIITWSTACMTDHADYMNGQISSLKVGLVGPLLDLIKSGTGIGTLRRCMRFADA
jgi:hypothetical protein